MVKTETVLLSYIYQYRLYAKFDFFSKPIKIDPATKLPTIARFVKPAGAVRDGDSMYEMATEYMAYATVLRKPNENVFLFVLSYDSFILTFAKALASGKAEWLTQSN